MKMWTRSRVRDVKDRDAELRMEWNNAYTTDVVKLKKQVEEFRARR